MNLFVSNIDFKISEEELTAMFAEYGTVLKCKILIDLETKKPKGYGFVLMSTNYEGQKCIIRLNKREINGRSLSVQEARPRPGKPGDKPKRKLRPRKPKTDD